MSRLFGRRSLENPRVSLQDEEAFLDLFGSTKSASGVRINRKTVLKHSAVYRGVKLIATSVAKLRLNVRIGDTKEVDRKHPAYRLLRRKANPEMSAFNFKRLLTAHAILQGNGFAYIFRRGDGTPLELRPLAPDRTYPFREGGQLRYLTTLGGTLEDGGEPVELDPDDVIHIQGLGWDGLNGYSLFELGNDELGLAIAGVKYGAKYFKNAAAPSVVIQFPGKLSDKAFKRLQASWQTMKAGLDNAHKPAIIDENGKVSPFAIKPADAQLIESRKLDLVSIANWLDLPVHKVGGEGRTAYGSLEQENQAFLDESLDGWLCNWESETGEKLLTEEEQETESRYIEFNRQQLVQANITQRYAAYRTALGGQPFMSANEARARENMPPVPGGDEILKPLNMGKGGQDNEPKPDPPANDGQQTDDEKPADEAQRALRAAHRQVLRDATRRMCRRLGTQMVRAATAGRLLAWMEEFRDEHGEVVREALGPAEAICRIVEEDAPVVEEFFHFYRDDLAGLPPFETGPEGVAAVERAAKRLETELPEAMILRFLGDDDR
ncbi:MAG: phage portal protein [Planctomycetaceae bacterium]|nr:phage portal protein [Planctomycetaceae bacterium]